VMTTAVRLALGSVALIVAIFALRILGGMT
jgi:hypothetical protein